MTEMSSIPGLLKRDVETAKTYLDGWSPGWECGIVHPDGVACGVVDVTAISTWGEREGSKAEVVVCFRRFAKVEGYGVVPLELIKVTIRGHSEVTNVEVTS